MNETANGNYQLTQSGKVQVAASYILKSLIVGGAIYAFYLRDYFMIFSAVVAVIGLMIPTILHRQWRIVLPLEFELILTFFIAAHFILGELGAFYVKYWWFDLFLHDFSGFIIGIVGFIWAFMLLHTNKVSAKPWFIFVFTFSLAMGAGALWEIFEFSMDQVFGFNMQKSGLVDTMGDLIVCAFGALLAGIVGFLYLKYRKSGFVRRIKERWKARRRIVGLSNSSRS